MLTAPMHVKYEKLIFSSEIAKVKQYVVIDTKCLYVLRA